MCPNTLVETIAKFKMYYRRERIKGVVDIFEKLISVVYKDILKMFTLQKVCIKRFIQFFKLVN